MSDMQLDTERDAAPALSETPVRRAPASPRTAERIRAQNRRREWLDQHPSYFENIEHELADPILYARLVKAFQTPAERQTEGQEKGFGRILEADLARGEQRLATAASSSSSAAVTATANGAATQLANGANGQAHTRSDARTGVDSPWDSEPEGRAHGRELWRQFLQERFIRGRDDEFDYDAVDGDWELDVTARREAQQEWFEDEEPTWAEGEGQARTGETGVQDY